MPAGEIRQIKRRIRSVASTKKITRAMELIASSRIIKAEQRLGAATPYADQMAHVIRNLAEAAGAEVRHALLEEHENPTQVAVLVVTSDRGLCGAYNSSVLKLATQTLGELPGDRKTAVAVGRKAGAFFRFRHTPVDRLWIGVSDKPTYDIAAEVADYLIDRFTTGDLDRVSLVYTRFESMFRQVPVAVPLLPVQAQHFKHHAAPEYPELAALMLEDESDLPEPDTIFEPGPEQILEEILPKGVTSRIFQALLESAASEHASRRRAMKSATDNAEDLIKALRLRGHKARQAAITTEIIEIVGGAQALEQAREAIRE